MIYLLHNVRFECRFGIPNGIRGALEEEEAESLLMMLPSTTKTRHHISYLRSDSTSLSRTLFTTTWRTQWTALDVFSAAPNVSPAW